MIATVHTTTLFGIDAIPVKVEVNITRGLHRQITGLPDQSVKECIDRLPDIITQLGFKMPKTRVTFHLSPSGIPKKGSSFDLPIIIALLIASEQLPDNNIVKEVMMAGEVTLDGSIKPVRGALSMAEKAKQQGYTGIIIPFANAKEAGLIDGINIYLVKHISEVIRFIHTSTGITKYSPGPLLTTPIEYSLDFKDIAGQHNLKRAMEIAAAGGHHTILVGPPGAGKSSVSRRLPSILPPMSRQEMLETTKIYSTLQTSVQQLMNERPFVPCITRSVMRV